MPRHDALRQAGADPNHDVSADHSFIDLGALGDQGVVADHGGPVDHGVGVNLASSPYVHRPPHLHRGIDASRRIHRRTVWSIGRAGIRTHPPRHQVRIRGPVGIKRPDVGPIAVGNVPV